MKRPILLLLLLIICFSCNKGDDEESVYIPWKVVLMAEQGSFTEAEITANAVYALWQTASNSGINAKTQVYKSINKGAGFSLLPYDPDLLFKGIVFMDNSIGFMAGHSLFAKTIDAGQTWDTTGTGLINFNSFYTLNSRVIGYGTGIYTSDDTAKTWLSVQPSTHSYTTMDFVDDQNGFTANSGGSLYKSSDAGSSWQEVTDLGNAEFYQIDFIDKNTGIAIVGIIDSPSAYPGIKLLYTDNGAQSWSEIELDSHGIELEPGSCCYFNADKQIYLGGVYGIYYSDDLGSSWSTQYAEDNPLWISDITFQHGIGIATASWMKVLKY